MSVPFKYRQHIRDLHDSFHDGKPISEEELMGVMNIIAADEHQALVESYRTQCPLGSNGFLSLMYELQKASKIPYDELVWNYIRGSLKKGIFNGEDRTELKALRSTLDPMMRAAHMDVPTLYKKHAPPDDEGRISIDQLCDVFRALYPANQVVYLEMYKWARATKIPKGRGGVIERAKTFEDVQPSNAAPVLPVVPAAPSAAVTAASLKPEPKETVSIEASTAAVSVTAAGDASKAAELQQKVLHSHVAAEEGSQVESKHASQVSGTSPNASGEDLPADDLNEPEKPYREVKQPADGKQLSDDGATVLLPITTASTVPPSPKAEREVETTAVKEARTDVQLASFVVSEGNEEKETLAPTTLATAEAPLPSCNSHDKEEFEEGKGVPITLKAAEVPSVLRTPTGFFSSCNLPPAVQLERRPGLNFNPPRIRDMEPPDRKQKNPTDGEKTLSPPPRLRGYEEFPSWEYEEALLNAILSRVVPGKPVDPQVVEYLRELARQEEELKSALRDEMENLTSNMLACEVVEQRMLLLRSQRQAQCFARMESRRWRLLEDMETYLSRVRKIHEQNKALLAGGEGRGATSSRKDGRSFPHDDATFSHTRQRSRDAVSMFAPPPPLLSAERQGCGLHHECRLGEKLQSMQNDPPAATWTSNVWPPQELSPPLHRLSSGMEREQLQRRFTFCPLGSTPQRQSVQVVHSRLGQHQLPHQLPSRLSDEEDLTIPANSGMQSLHSPLPRQPASRGVNPYLTAKLAANMLTSSPLQRKVEERLAVRLSRASQPF
ncbi:hypothetical protein TraAM80_06610 [Trypanosoma rangeli]|uniref:Uncharacterized protein n=1 Tax=Trypanosoma rangeli TaxID=5698 RepID=A0A3R7M9W2_TRYRA|nr:uncharacterized protein TraAM80_06610 [Trypanosoma rangeli]RNF02067.1 hypothetical protein TraAM80_06610 [Trypanosoma rangeli]|eukprot:RNF02067.1 hypothetical protein TraAM80_06610 [Trypanosoma rangeli]